MSSPEPQLVLVGPMAAGKTRAGKRVARLLDVPFRDSDKVIVAEHGPIPAIFAEQGEAAFRAIERETVAELMHWDGIVSLGGGAVIDAGTRELLRERTVVYVTVSEEAVATRLEKGGRPLLAGDEDPVVRWARIHEERRAWYEEVADAIFDTSGIPMDRVAENIVAWLKERSTV